MNPPGLDVSSPVQGQAPPDPAGVELRYDAPTMHHVLTLAAELQGRQEETFSLQEIEAVGMEAGLQPAVIWKALAQVAAHPVAELRQERRREFQSLLLALGIAPPWGGLWFGVEEYLVHHFPYDRGTNIAMILGMLLLPVLLAVGQGFIAGRRWAGFAAGSFLAFCTVPAFGCWLYYGSGFSQFEAWLGVILYLLLGGAAAGGLGTLGSFMRNYYFPTPELRNVDCGLRIRGTPVSDQEPSDQ
jgi:hypothetical protein